MEDGHVDDQNIPKEQYRTKYSFPIDLFAFLCHLNCNRFYSNFYCRGTSGIDDFFAFVGKGSGLNLPTDTKYYQTC